MKKIFLAMVFGASVTIVAAQDRLNSSFGIKAGGNFYKIKGDDYDDGYKTKTGFHGGIFYHAAITELLRIQPELVYSSEGIKFEDEDLEANVQLNYLNLPIMFQFFNSSGFYLESGPQIGFVLSAKAKYEETGGDKYEEEIDEGMNKTAFSWGFGTGFMKGRFGLGARYNIGLSKIPKEDDAQKDKSTGFQVSLIARLKK